jgi:uncharacterized delta-60 repeat protein
MLSFFSRTRHRPARPTPRARRAPRPRLEALEDRCLLSAGALDPSFGTGGIVSSMAFAANDLALQGDGRIVTVGIGHLPGNGYGKFGVARYNADGSADTSFGAGGTTVTSLGNYYDYPEAVALQADNKILVAGMSAHFDKGWTVNWDMALVRYNSNGTLDTTFGTKGVVTTTFSKASSDEAWDMALQADGKIVLGGWVSDSAGSDFALERFTANGSLDTTFGTGGRVRIHFNSGPVHDPDNESPIRMVIQPPDASGQQKLVITGTVNDTSATNNPEEAALARVNANGTLDGGFGSGGEVHLLLGGSSSKPNGLALQPDGKLVVVGVTAVDPSLHVLALARLTGSGALDTTFNGSGVLDIDISSSPYYEDTLSSVAIQADGKIVAAGTTNSASIYPTASSDFVVLRVNSDGTLDTTFGGYGIVITPVTSAGDGAYALLLQPDGNIVAGGTALVRYQGGP